MGGRAAADFLSLILGSANILVAGAWKCENPALGFSRGGGKCGKLAFGFPHFPPARHFHGPPPLAERRWNRSLRFALPQQTRLGRVHLPGALGVAHPQRFSF